ncbi:restriction endonuclease subunit S [Pseudomonas sp. JV241A]|uniref:restriction endonuclease subunit S n=1 Tax=Pseudomonas sp. JV241A TaxID=2078785 RepID=UPI00100D884B|nr:restriction endonuclease subunit S [Pseudomonas sp. JV241A]SPO67118.1 conserved protein of unknown function [Pseudomonas sp. JV241A]
MSQYKPYAAYKDSGVEWLGRVPEHWVTKKLLYWISGYGSGTTPSSEDEYSTDGIPWVTTGELRENTVFITEKRVTHDSLKSNSALKLHPAGSLVIAMYGATVGRLGVLGIEATLNQACFAIHPSERVLISFLRYWFEGFRTELVGLATGAGQPNISGDKIRNLLLPCPQELSEQEAIITHLDRETARIDTLIGKKTRFVELLREKRYALITHAITKGLNPRVKMKDSGVEWLGEVPDHWCVKQLKHVVDPNSSITYGIVQAGPEFEGGVPYIRTSDMSSDELPVNGYPLTSPEIDKSYARSRVRPGDIVMSIRASVGKCLPVPDELSIANLTQGTAKVSPGQKITREFLLAFLNSGAAQVYFDLMAKGATFKEITLDALRRTPVLLPPRDEQVEIDRFIALHVGRLDRLIRLSERSVVMLKERRSALITAAVTGQIDLREAV